MTDYSIIEDNIEPIKEMAAQGDADAQNKLGISYKLGLAGFPIDYEEAAKWYTKSAEQGWAKAQSNLAFCYLKGEGVKNDAKAAVEWFTKSAEQGNATAQYQLGYCYEFGRGVPQDLNKAAEWYEKSAMQGHHTARTNLAYCYESGRGTTQDYEKAAEWYAKAAEQGDARALNNLGVLYENGRGVDKDLSKAFELYSKSAEQGYDLALANVGYCYEKGVGTTQSYLKADSYYRQAAEKGNMYAKNALKRIEENVKAEEFFKSIKFTTRQKIGKEVYARVIPFGKNYIVKRKGLWGIVNKHNTQLLPIEYTRVHWFDGGYAGIQMGKLWGLVNSEGTITIEPQYETLHYNSEKQACDVENGENRFLVDANNNIIMRVKGKTVRFSGDKLMVCSKGEWQLYNMDGTPFSKVHSLISSYYDYYEAYDDGKKTLIKENGEEVKLPSFEIGVFKERITQFRYQDKYGIIDDDANIVVPNQYDYITLGDGIIAINEGNKTKDNDRYFLARPREGKWFFWNYEFKEITPYKYDNIDHEYSEDGKVWFAEREERWYQIKPEGEELYANSESEFKKKKAGIEKKRRKEPGWGKFNIYEDMRFRGDGRKLFVRSCDGYYIKKYYFSPYLPSDSDMNWQKKIGEYFVNKYGQDMFNPHAFKMPKQKKKRHVFRLNPSIMSLSDKDMIKLFVGLIKPFGFEQQDVTNLYIIYQTKRKRAILCDWLLRKYKRNKKIKFEFEELTSLLCDIEVWDKKNR